MSSDIGLIGLAVMGQNLALNMAEKGFKVSVFNRTAARVDEAVERATREKAPLDGYKDMKQFVESLRRPRRIFILVKAGPAVDETIEQLLPFLSEGDLVADGGNEWYENTARRARLFEGRGLRYMGVGVSGGEEGARHGPSLMPGGTKEGFSILHEILAKIAAQVDDGPCVSYIGPGGAGNYVKMVHNGIEYGDMQLIAEAYSLMKNIGGLCTDRMAAVFREWNSSRQLQSYLVEITAEVLSKKDDMPSRGAATPLVDLILDVAGSKGTGKWTVQEAAERGVPCPTIAAALDMRYMSAFKEQRVAASKMLQAPHEPSQIDETAFLGDVMAALYCSKICAYAQGMALLRAASNENKWGLNLGEIARTWKGGCIIRAALLDDIKSAFAKDATLGSLLLDTHFAAEVLTRLPQWERIVSVAAKHGVAVPAISASLNYFYAYRTASLPVNLIQAQRDHFGAHTYQRVDREGVFHSAWGSS
eukprot:Polyplicarium_translucidae@DN2196_c0_g1_i3.p1